MFGGSLKGQPEHVVICYYRHDLSWSGASLFCFVRMCVTLTANLDLSDNILSETCVMQAVLLFLLRQAQECIASAALAPHPRLFHPHRHHHLHRPHRPHHPHHPHHPHPLHHPHQVRLLLLLLLILHLRLSIHRHLHVHPHPRPHLHPHHHPHHLHPRLHLHLLHPRLHLHLLHPRLHLHHLHPHHCPLP